MEEIWKDIKNYEGLYQVSNLGDVKTLDKHYTSANGGTRHIKEHVLYKGINHKGYYVVTLCKDGKRAQKFIHRIVAETFIQNTDNKPQVDHIDGDKKNNYVGNLRWVSNKENCNNPNTNYKNRRPHTEEWKQKMSAKMRGKTRPKHVVKAVQESHYKKVGKYKNGCLIKTYKSITEASIDVGVTASAISNSIKRNGNCRGYKWRLVA